jgi:hypothetical protein
VQSPEIVMNAALIRVASQPSAVRFAFAGALLVVAWTKRSRRLIAEGAHKAHLPAAILTMLLHGQFSFVRHAIGA